MSKNKKNKKFNKNMNPTEKNQPQDEEVLKTKKRQKKLLLTKRLRRKQQKSYLPKKR